MEHSLGEEIYREFIFEKKRGEPIKNGMITLRQQAAD